MKSIEDGELEISDGFVDEMYFCLDCQACETVCPAGVQYGSLVEEARARIVRSNREPLKLKILRKLILRGILSSSSRIRWLAAIGRLQQRLGILTTVSKLRIVPQRFRDFASMLPPVPPRAFDETVGEILRPDGKPRRRVGFLTGCVMNVLYPEIHRDSVDVLLHNDCEIVIPRSQVCCGSLLAHHGDFDTARDLARKNLEAFANTEIDALVVNSAGCSAFIKEYGHLFKDDPSLSQQGVRLASKCKDILEFLLEIDFKRPTGQVSKRVTYHEACHLVHSQKISDQPREILRGIPGLEYVELEESSWCCGSAGIYNLVRYEDSMKLLERKMGHIQSTSADIVCTANPGCLMQLRSGNRKFDVKAEPLHVVTLLRRAYERSR